MKHYQADVIIVGAGLSGLVAAAEVADAGKSVLLLDQEGEKNLGGQAFWSFGGIFLVNSPEQRRLGIRDSYELAFRDWMTTAGFDREDDYWPRQWASAYVDFATNELRQWLHHQGIRFFPAVGWAERGGSGASAAGNSVPRFHITWGTGPGLLKPFIRRVNQHVLTGRIKICYRHRVTGLNIVNRLVQGVRGEILEPTNVERGQESSRLVVGDFEIKGLAVMITSGGLGGNHELVRKNWPVDRLGPAPQSMISGVPMHVDGYLQNRIKDEGARLINIDRMWHYTEGLRNWNPIWQNHGIRILAGPSSLWLDPTGRRLPFPNFPGCDTLSTLQYITSNGYTYTWFLSNHAIIKKEFALSGSEQNPDLTEKNIWLLLKRLGKQMQAPLQAFLNHGADFVVKDNLRDLVEGMNALVGEKRIAYDTIEREVLDRDLQVMNKTGKDTQLAIVRSARVIMSERLIRIAKPAPILANAHGPLIAVRLSILTRKTLGGLETDLDSRVIGQNGQPMQGLFAAGEVAGFGGGGVHGYRALEGTFLGGCIFTGRTAGRAVVKTI